MTSEEWEKSGDPAAMLRYLTRRTEDLEEKTTIYPSDRKLRLFACACRRQTRLPWDGPSAGWTRMEDHPEEPIQGANAEYHAMLFVGEHRHPDVSLTVAADLLRAIVGNPWRPYTLDPEYRTPLVLSLAEAAYEERKRQETCSRCNGKRRVWDDDPRLGIFENYMMDCLTCHGTGTVDRDDGTLDPQRMAILADALEDAGVSEMVECPGCIAILQPYSGGLWPCRECGAASWQDRGRIPNPLLARLRSGGPFYRGEASLDVVLGRE